MAFACTIPAVGTAYGRPFGAEHDVMNGGTEKLAFIEIELKRAQSVAYPPLPTTPA